MYVMNASRMMKSCNLGKDAQGKHKSMILRPQEVSRLLTDEEAGCPEVRKLLQLRELVSVSEEMAKRRAGASGASSSEPFVIVESPKQ